MKSIIKLFGLLMFLAGLSLLLIPECIIEWIEGNAESRSLYISAIVLRLVLGVLFIVTAKESKFPVVMKVLGYLFVIAAIILIVMGQESFQDFIASLIPDVTPYAPVSGALAMAFGGFIVYAFYRNKAVEKK